MNVDIRPDSPAPLSNARLSAVARAAAQANDWLRVVACAAEILSRNRTDVEGNFLAGLAENAANRATRAARHFENVIRLDGDRYDAAIELAHLRLRAGRHGEAVRLLRRYEERLANSPRYLDMAGTVYMKAGLPEPGLQLLRKANELQPGIASLRENIAACSVFLGKIEEARRIYCELLEIAPNHQRNHFELSRLRRATDFSHVDQMKSVLHATRQTPDKNIYLYYALGKELEDLGEWDEAFKYYQMAGHAAKRVAAYDIREDIQLIEDIIAVCTKEWLADPRGSMTCASRVANPMFVMGLPRSGTTVTERILSGHSMVESIGESYFMHDALVHAGRGRRSSRINGRVIRAAANRKSEKVAKGYMSAVGYRLSGSPMFIEKFPENFLYLGLIAKAFPEAPLIHQQRGAMDNCFALFKQSYFRYAYTLDDIGQYYVAHDRLSKHWEGLLGDRLIEVSYESLVSDLEIQARHLFSEIGIPFEDACLNFQGNPTPVWTASAVEVRSELHNRSVNKWRYFEKHLEPLRDQLKKAGINT